MNNIILDDGTIVRNVPDGVTKEQVQAKVDAKRARDTGTSISDYARALASGVNRIGSSLAGMADNSKIGDMVRMIEGTPTRNDAWLESGGMPLSKKLRDAYLAKLTPEKRAEIEKAAAEYAKANPLTERVRKFFDSNAGYWNSGMTEGAKAKRAYVGEGSDIVDTLLRYKNEPQAALLAAVENTPQIGLAMATKNAPASSRAVINAGVEAAMNGEDARQGVLDDASKKFFADGDNWDNLKGVDPAAAIIASNEANKRAIAATLLLSPIGAASEIGALRRLGGQAPIKGAEFGLKQIPKQAWNEAVEEFGQESLSKAAQNKAIADNYDPSVGLLDGAGVAGVHGAVAGGVMGAGRGMLMVPKPRSKTGTDTGAGGNPSGSSDPTQDQQSAAMDELRAAAEQGQQPEQPEQPQDMAQPAPAQQEPASGLSGVVQRAQASTAPDLTTVVNEAIASGQTPDFSALAQAANRDRSEVVDLFNRRRTLVDLADAGDLNGMRDMAARMTADPQEQQSLIEQAVAVRDKRRAMASQPQPTQQAEPQQPATPIKTPRDTAYEKMLADAEASLASGASDVDTFLAVRKKYAGNKDLVDTDINGVIDDAKTSLSGKREAAAKREAAIESAIPHLKSGDEVSAVTALADAGITDDADIQAVFKEANSRLKAKPAAAQAKPQHEVITKSPMEQAVEAVNKAQEGGKGVKLATIAKKYGVSLVDLAKQVVAAKTAPVNTKQPEEEKPKPSQVLALPAPQDAPIPADQPLVSRRGKLLPKAQADAMAEQSAAEKRDMRRAMSEEAGNPTGVPVGMRPRVEVPARKPQKAVLPDVILRTDGNPFPNEAEATRAMNRRGAQETHEVTPAPQGSGVVVKRKKANTIDVEKDDILAAIAKAGGVNWEQARKQGGFDPAESGRRGSGILRVFKKNGGMTLDGMAEHLSQFGYPVTDENGDYTVNALLDAMDTALRGGQVGTAQFNERLAREMYEQEAELRALDDALDGGSSGDMPPWLDDGADALAESVIDGETQPSAVLADALSEVENERTIASPAAGTGQKAESGAEAGAGQGSNAPAAGAREGGQQEGKGGAGQDSGVQAGFQLKAQTEAERFAEEQRQAAMADAQRKEEESARLKAQADREISSFTLTGSDRPADVAMAAGQKDLFGPRTRGEKEAEKNQPKSDATISDSDYAQVVEAAKYLKDIVYSMDNLVGDDTNLLIALSSDLGKSGRDTILMDAFGIDRSLAHTINNRLDDRKPHKLRAVDMGDAFTTFPMLRKVVDDAKDVIRKRMAISQAQRPQPGDANYTAELADQDLDAMLEQQRQNGLVKDDRLAERIRRQEKLIDELRADEKAKASPAEDLDSMFDDVLAEVTGKPKAEPAKQERTAGQEPVESAFTGEPDSRNSAPMQELGGFAVGDKVSISGRSFSEGVIRKLFTRQSVGGEMRMARVEVAGGKTLDLLIDNLSVQERTAGQAAASAAKNTGMALGEAIDGLGKLFGGKGTLGSGPVFDEETYAKAKPYFIAAISHLKAAVSDLREAMRAVIKMVVDKFGVDAAENMKPYVVQFISDVRDGKIDDPAATLKGSDTNEATGNDVRKLDTTGQGALEGVSSGEVQGAATGRGTGSGTTEGGRGDGGADGSVAGAGSNRDGGMGNSSERVPVSGTGAGGSGRGRSRSSGGNGRAVSAQSAASNEQESSGGLTADANQPSMALEPGRIDPPQLTEDFIIEDDLGLGEGGQRTKYKNNVEAIRLIRDLEATGRTATTDEQKVLAKYVGWGGIPQAFDPDNKDWSAQYAELKSLLSADEWDAAFESTQYAHYTSREIINGMYAAVRRLGFTGGNVLEAGGGVGNFIGLMPVDLRTNGKVTLIERENIAAAIAKHLYPRQNVRSEDFTEFGKGQDGQYDMQIGNPPFSSNPLTDKSGRKHLTGLSVHNYFITKGVDMLRDGGIMAVVVSNSFMDASNSRAREYIAKRAKLLGAIRLPNNAFSKNANTQVTTDIIFLQKLPESEHGSKAAIADGKRWVGVTAVSDPQGKGKVALNQYFADNRGMMLGEWGAFGTMYGPDQPALVARPGQDTAVMMARAVASLPEGVYTPASTSRTKAMEGALLEKLHDNSVGEGGFYVKDGKVWQRVADSVGEAYAAEITPNTVISGTRPIGQSGVDRLRQLAELRRTMRELLAAETEDRKSDMDRLRKELNTRYDAYTADNGRINDPTTKRLMRDDPDYPLIAALEMDYEPGIGPAAAKTAGIKPQTSKAKKAAIFNQRVIEARKAVTKADSPQDAINISMAEQGRLDAEYIGRLLDVPADEVLGQLASGTNPLLFRDPATDEYVLRDAYLSGNVREKLKQAKAAGLTSNARALEEVQPEDIPASKVSVRIGSPWVPVSVYADFASNLFGEGTKTILRYVKSSGGFSGVIIPGSEVMASTKFGTKSYHGDAILLALMNNRQIKVMTKDENGKSVLDAKATDEASAKADDIKQAFQDWIFKDADRAEVLVRAYNDANNNYVVRKYDGSWLKFPGKVPDAVIRFRRHQRNAIARTIQDRTTLYDHVVGAGKTFTAIASAMEMRRMGLIRKPLMVVPNHLVGQWASDFYRLYPGAKVLAATKKDFERENRRRFLAKIASGDWDAVIIAHSSFERIRPSAEFEQNFIQEEIDRIMREAKAVDESEGDEQQKKRTVKQLAAMQERLENRIAKLREKPMDDLLDFQQIGVDQLFVDEAHLFKNLMYTTKMQNIRGLNDPTGSQRAYDMYIKTNQIMEMNGRGQGVVFMTGTPVSNSLAEMYHMMRYLMPIQMRQLGFESFDAWANTYADIKTVFVPKPSGDGFKQQSRFSKFSNVHQLLATSDQVIDTVTMDDIKAAYKEETGKDFPLPRLLTGRRQPVSLEKTPLQEAYMKQIIERLNKLESRKGPPKKGEDNHLSVMSDSRKAAMDIRLVDKSVIEREENGRVDRASSEIFSRWKKYDAERGTQLVFADLGTPVSTVKSEVREYDAIMARITAGEDPETIASAQLGDEAAVAKVNDAEDAHSELDAKGDDWLTAIEGAKRGFSVYDDLKKALMEKGIPENQIAFIHSYNTDDQKAALFRKVNSGEIRILMGSTSKMGAGTNVQKRLVALHHLDVPWKPSDLEQREGRIIRQGNELADNNPDFEVEILAYATKDTLDSFMWDLQGAKLKGINQLRTRDIDNEIPDAFAELEMSAGEMQAAATGNTDMLREIQLRTEVQKMERRQRAFDAGKSDAIAGIRRATREIESLPVQIAAYERLTAASNAVQQDVADARARFKATINGKEYTNHTEAAKVLRDLVDAVETGEDGKERKAKLDVTMNGEQFTNRQKLAEAFARLTGDNEPFVFDAGDGKVYRIDDAADAVMDTIASSRDSEGEKLLGNMGDYKVSIEYGGEKLNQDEAFEVHASLGDDDLPSAVVRAKPGDDRHAAKEILKAVRNMVRDAGSALSSLKASMEKAKKNLADLSKIDTTSEWPDSDKLARMREEHRALRDKMNKEAESKKAAESDDSPRMSTQPENTGPTGGVAEGLVSGDYSVNTGGINERNAGSLQSRKRAYGSHSAESHDDLFATAAVSPTNPEARRNRTDFSKHFTTVSENIEHGQVKVPERIAGHADAAAIFSRWKDYSQERFIVAGLDENGRVVEVAVHSVGLKDSASVDPGTVAGMVSRNPDIKSVWISHNHPSGSTEKSAADSSITAAVDNLISATGIKIDGHVILGSSAYSVIDATGEYIGGDGKTAAFAYKTVVGSQVSAPLVDRVITRRGLGAVTISGPGVAKSYVSGMNEPGIVLMDTQLNVLGFWAMTPEQMNQMRQNQESTRSLLAAIDASNASRAIISVADSIVGNGMEWKNISAMLASSGIEVVDAISYKSRESAAENGMQIPQKGRPFYSTSPSAPSPGLTIDRAREILSADPVLSKALPFIDIRNSKEGVPEGAEPMYLPAWHGSPYKFDKFSLEHLGKGEGEQAYGWGLYFADKREIAEYYRLILGVTKYLSENQFNQDGTPNRINQVAFQIDAGVAREDILDGLDALGYSNDDALHLLRDAQKLFRDLDKGTGQLYKVDIPEDGNYLLWDAPLSDQPASVKKALEIVRDELEKAGVIDDYLDRKNAEWGELTGKDIYEIIKRASKDDALSVNGPGVQSAQENGMDDKAASMYLHNDGISGIKYLDGSSRAKGDGSYNYVIFDDNAVRILETHYSAGDAGAEGYYHNGRITLFADNIRATGSMSAEERLKWVAFHEITHRGVANLAESREYMAELQRAGKNPYVKNLAKKIYEARQSLDAKYHVSMEVAIEEALAEINAALRTGNVKQIKEQYGLHFPLSIRPRAKSAVARFFEVVKRIVNRVFGRGLTDSQVEDLLRRTNDAGMTPDGGPGRGKDYDAAVFSLADKGDGSPTESALAEARRQLDEQLAIADRMIAERGGLFAPNGEASKLSREQWAMVRTANFKNWFGDWENAAGTDAGTAETDGRGRPDNGAGWNLGGDGGNAKNRTDAGTKGSVQQVRGAYREVRLDGSTGEPRIFFHGTKDEITAFDLNHGNRKDHGWLGTGVYVTSDYKLAESYSGVKRGNGSPQTMALFANVRNPYIATTRDKEAGMMRNRAWADEVTATDKRLGYDGVVLEHHDGTLELVAFDPNQIKSATGNAGTFSGRTDDIRYSPSPKDWITEQGRITKRVLSKEVAQRDLTLWQKTLGTPLNAALKNPAFEKVYDMTQRLIQHVNNDAYDSLNAAPDVLSRLEDWNDYKRDIVNTAKEVGAALTLQQSKRRKDMTAAAEVLFEGTRFDKKVYSDEELDAFKLTADQKEIYRQARAAIDKSVGNAGKSQALNVAMNAEAINWATVERLVNMDLDPEVLFSEVSDLIDTRIAATKMEAENSTSEAEIKKLDKQVEKLSAALASIGEIQAIVEKSATEGYAPLMRWGKYTVAVIDPVDGKTLRFHMLESKREQAALELKLREKYGVANVVGDVLDEGKFEQFKGITPETVALFASVTGMDQDAAYQEYLKLAIPGRSALKRKIHRKGDMGEGIEGFSTDLPRVLSSFVLSNARKSARDLYRGPINDAIKSIKVGGGVAAKARELAEFVLEPDENDWSVGIRNLLFVWNMGASVAFGILNLSQPWMMTLPWLSQFQDPASAAGTMAKAAKLAASAQASGKAPKGYEAEYDRAVRGDVVDPQNVFMLQGVERGKSGVGSNIWRNVAHGMGLIAAATESMNRKLTLIAALDVARAKGDAWLKSKGFADAYDFAARAVAETQGVYNKGNRPAWARDPALAVILVFKQYSINWVEMASRMASNHYGDDRYRKGFWMLIGALFMMAGGMGLPFAEDLIDLIEAGMSWAGKPVNVERQMQMALGKDLYEPLMNGPANSLLFNPMGADMFGRMSMGNMIPATAVANPGLTPAARSDEAIQALGAGAGLASKFMDAYNLAAAGKVGQAAITASPRAVTSVAKAVEMAATGQYKDSKGRNVRDVTPAEALIKGLDLQPASVARIQRERGRRFKDEAIQAQARTEIRNELIDAYEAGDQDAIDAANTRLRTWNAENPLYPVHINRRGLRKTVRERGKNWSARDEAAKGMEWTNDWIPESSK